MFSPKILQPRARNARVRVRYDESQVTCIKYIFIRLISFVTTWDITRRRARLNKRYVITFRQFRDRDYIYPICTLGSLASISKFG